jgi:hypothetical protein
MPLSMHKNLCVAMSALLVLLSTAPAAFAAKSDSGEPLVTRWKVGDISPDNKELDELDEVMVWGQKAAIAIADLEDEYYDRYNKLNKNNNYDVHCSYINTDPDNPGSALRSRICIPEFVIDAMQEWAQGRCDQQDFFSLDLNKDNVLSEAEAAGNRQLLPQLYALDSNHDRRITYTEFIDKADEYPDVCYQPPPPELVLVGGTKKWQAQMLEVTNGDPQLKQMASDLGLLYGQLRVLQKHAGKLEAEELGKMARR